jgi:hypothetical protein
MNTYANVNMELRVNDEGVIGILYYSRRDIHAADHHSKMRLAMKTPPRRPKVPIN